MRNVAVLALGVLLLIVQGNLFRILGPFGVHGFTPSLVLPVVLFLGVHEPSMARGALLSCALGYATDLLAAAPIGLFAFSSVAIWWLSRVAAVRLTAQTLPTQIILAGVFALVESLVVLVLLTIFGQDPQRPIEIARAIMAHAGGTALLAPPVFRITRRLHQGANIAHKPADGGAA